MLNKKNSEKKNAAKKKSVCAPKIACCAARLAAAVAQNGYFDPNVAPSQQLSNALLCTLMPGTYSALFCRLLCINISQYQVRVLVCTDADIRHAVQQ